MQDLTVKLSKPDSNNLGFKPLRACFLLYSYIRFLNGIEKPEGQKRFGTSFLSGLEFFAYGSKSALDHSVTLCVTF